MPCIFTGRADKEGDSEGAGLNLAAKSQWQPGTLKVLKNQKTQNQSPHDPGISSYEFYEFYEFGRVLFIPACDVVHMSASLKQRIVRYLNLLSQIYP